MEAIKHEQGTITEVWEPEGYGIVRTSEGELVRFARANVRGNEFPELFVGTEVTFVRRPSPQGWLADDVAVVRQDRRLLPL